MAAGIVTPSGHNFGLVRYHVGAESASHDYYMRELGARELWGWRCAAACFCPRVAEKSRSKKDLKSRLVNSKLWFAPIKEILLSVPRLSTHGIYVFIHCLSR